MIEKSKDNQTKKISKNKKKTYPKSMRRETKRRKKNL
jgi:hypothetical protein